MLVSRNQIIQGNTGKPIVLDIGYPKGKEKSPLIIFAHGFKGFKDWGHFNAMMNYFIDQGFAFIKFNFSYNGGTVDQPIDFPDLEAFGNNNYSKELSDVRTVIDWVTENDWDEVDVKEIYLIGHSRGGGIAILAANEDDRIKKVITWAAVSDLINRFSGEQMTVWEKEGVLYVENARTKQQMPLYYQLAQDTLNHKERFDIQQAVKGLNTPHLIIHGDTDQVVPVEEAHKIKSWNRAAQLFVVEGGDHVFGASHPYHAEEFPITVQKVLQETLAFINK